MMAKRSTWLFSIEERVRYALVLDALASRENNEVRASLRSTSSEAEAA